MSELTKEQIEGFKQTMREDYSHGRIGRAICDELLALRSLRSPAEPVGDEQPFEIWWETIEEATRESYDNFFHKVRATINRDDWNKAFRKGWEAALHSPRASFRPFTAAPLDIVERCAKVARDLADTVHVDAPPGAKRPECCRVTIHEVADRINKLAPSEPGMVMVPREPTEEMKIAGANYANYGTEDSGPPESTFELERDKYVAAAVYKAMLASQEPK